jgi:hypothetical protein
VSFVWDSGEIEEYIDGPGLFIIRILVDFKPRRVFVEVDERPC